MTRKISGLRWVKQAQNPWPRARPRGAKRAGLIFQHQVLGAMGFKEEVWFEFEDRNGPGYCSPDGLGLWDGQVVIAEVKLTQTLTALTQLQDLYAPVVETFYQKIPLLLAICKFRTRQAWPGLVTQEPRLALESIGVPLLHLPLGLERPAGATGARSWSSEPSRGLTTGQKQARLGK